MFYSLFVLRDSKMLSFLVFLYNLYPFNGLEIRLLFSAQIQGVFRRRRCHQSNTFRACQRLLKRLLRLGRRGRRLSSEVYVDTLCCVSHDISNDWITQRSETSPFSHEKVNANSQWYFASIRINIFDLCMPNVSRT